MNTKYFIDTEANDDAAYIDAMKFACELAKKDSDIKRIVLYIASKQNTGWFERIYDYQTVKELFKGIKFKDCPVIFKFETRITYKNAQYGGPHDIVISCGMDSDDLFKIDDYYSVKYIIAIPWLKRLTEKWIKTWHAIDISKKNDNTQESFPEPSCIVKRALESLTNSINMSTGITNPFDNERAKTYIRALHKYEPELNADIVSAYLVRELNWDTRHAKEIEKLINTLNEGRYYTDLKVYFKSAS